MTENSVAAVEAASVTANDQDDPRDRQIRRLKVWVVILTVMLGLGTLCGCAFGSMALVGGSPIDLLMMAREGSFDQTEAITDSVKQAYDERLQSVEVEKVKVDMGEVVPFPYQLLNGPGDVYFVRYRLKGAPVDIAGVLSDAGMLTETGLIPILGAIGTQIDQPTLLKLMAAHVELHGSEPMGPVLPFIDRMSLEEGGQGLVPGTITKNGKTYSAAELWRVQKAVLPEDGKIQVDLMDAAIEDVYHIDPNTGEITFVGTQENPNGVMF